MAINFPNNPTAGVTTYISGNTTWLWDGIAWNVVLTDTGFATEDYVDQAVGGIDLTGLATEDYVDQAVGDIDLTGLATEDYVDTAIGNIPSPSAASGFEQTFLLMGA